MQVLNSPPPLRTPKFASSRHLQVPILLLLSMDPELEPPKSRSTRYKCSACYKQYKKKEHLVMHMKVSYHSVHQPKCGVCQKFFKSFESLREHITGPLPNANCSKEFSNQGCSLCLKVFDSSESRDTHMESCRLNAPTPLGTPIIPYSVHQIPGLENGHDSHRGPEAVAMDCEMVGGGIDDAIEICVRVCLVDEDDNPIFCTYVRPEIPVTNYRFEITGITEEDLRDAMPLKEARDKILQILYNGETVGRSRLDGGKARLLVGHDLEKDLNCLKMSYPDHLHRDTAKYRPLMKTNFVSHSLKYLTKAFLGYEIQTGVHEPYEDASAAMRLYRRMRSLEHPEDTIGASNVSYHTQSFISTFDSCKTKQLLKMTPDELLQISKSNYRCWCLDVKQASRESANVWPTW